MKNIFAILKSHKAIAAIVAAVLLLSAASLYFLYPKNTKQINTQINANQNIVLTVTAKSVDDMYGYQLRVNYDEKKFEYKGELKSEVNAISTIFTKQFNGYQQIGATMTGHHPGVSEKNAAICKMKFAARKDCKITDSTFGISKIGMVSSTLKYDENVSGWNYKIEVLK